MITGALAQSPEFGRRLHAEPAAHARADSPYVTQILDHDEVDGVLFIVSQYVDGTGLSALLRSGRPLPARSALHLVAQLARGLREVHRHGIVHRDVKAGNVLARDGGTPDAHVYLCD